MEELIIKEEMKKFQSELGYEFKDINWLTAAMKSVKISIDGEGANHKEYTNEALATVGDTLIKSILSIELYNSYKEDGQITKGKITKEKEKLEKNETMKNLVINEGWINYAYNEYYFHKDNPLQHLKVCSKKHSPYVEAIAAAIYFDSNLETLQDWVIHTLKPLLEKNIVK